MIKLFRSPRVTWLVSKVTGQKILDIGFIGEATAELVVHKLIRAKNPKSQVIGLDTNEAKIKESGLDNCVVGSLYKIPFPENTFDAVILGEVIEHLIEVLPAFQEISRVLKPGGKLYLTTPSCYGLFRWLKHWLFSRRFYDFKNVRNFLGNDDHKLYWEPLSLCNFLNRAGLDVVEMTTTNLSFPYLPFGLREIPLPFWPFSRLGTYYCLIAKKK